MMPRDDQPQIIGKYMLLDQAQRFGRVSDPPYVGKSLFQHGHTHERLKRVVLHQ